AGKTRDDVSDVDTSPSLPVLQEQLGKEIDSLPVRHQYRAREPRPALPARVGAASDRDDPRVVKQRQGHIEIAQIQLGVGIKDQDCLEGLEQPEVFDTLPNGASLSDIRARLRD